MVRRRRGMPGGARGAVIVLVSSVLGAGPGCGRFRAHRQELERLHAAGRYEAAADLLEEAREELYRRDALLWHLDRGAVALANGEVDLAVEQLEVAEGMIDLKREARPDEVVATWLVSERSAPYLAEPYEDMYVNVLKLLAQLEAGRIDGYATVEARRLAWKADHLRDLHGRWMRALRQEASSRVGGLPSAPGSGSGGKYIESTLGTYLSAIAFMEAGEGQMQAVAARRLVDSIEKQRGLIGPVDAENFDDLEGLTPDGADLLVVALSGRGPTKYAERVGPIVIYTVPIYFELPRMRRHGSEVGSVVVEVEGWGEAELDLVEDMAAVAAENHERYLPLVYTRTLLRAAIKATGTAIAASAASEGDDSGLAVLGVVLGGLLLMGATEQADLRSWAFLPGQARVGVLDLPEGTYRLRTVYRSASGGTVYSTGWREVEIDPRGLRTFVDHYWR